MFNRSLTFAKLMFPWQRVLVSVVGTSLLLANFPQPPAQAEIVGAYCRISRAAAQEKKNLRLAALEGNQEANSRYSELLQEHAQAVQECRRRTWPQVEAVWLRLYPCDLQPGAIDQIMDRIVDRGYNQVYVQVFYDGQVLLPAANNPTIWPSVIRNPGTQKVDLLLEAIEKGRRRGLKVYAWMYTLNFGYTYALHRDREAAIARNGKGQTSLYVSNGSDVFIDPYNLQAKRDYYQMLQEVLRRRPDGVLFDYIRYVRQSGSDSISTKVTDLWLYTQATQQALFQRALNNKGLELIRRFLSRGYITAGDVSDVDKMYPQEGEPMWQGRVPPPGNTLMIPPEQRQPFLQRDLWQLAVAHAMQGVLDFANLVAYPGQQLGIPAGVVFFPEGNQSIGQGYDSRLQPWDRFPSSLEWNPMAYANCGDVSCIAAEVQRVVSTAKPGTEIIPAIAGKWGESVNGRPSLEAQMQALQQFAPQLRGVSHFAYSWQEPKDDDDRKYCRAQ